jgi:acetolactate synthase regulatory subunit
MERLSTFKLSLFLFSICLFQCLTGEALPKIKMKHKDDVVVMENGDRITGEIKKMEFGVLYFKSDRAVDTLKLDWERVTDLQSIAQYEFETQNKDIYIGIISKDDTSAGELKIDLGEGAVVQLRIIEIIAVHEMGRSFLTRINLTLDAGLSYTSANSRKTSTINLSALFRRPKYSASLSFNSQFSSEPGTENTERQELQFLANRYLKRKWEAVGLAAFLHDNQQDLDLRTTAGGGIERIFYESNRTLFYTIGGVVYTNENYFDIARSDRNNIEALAAFGLSTYRFRGSSLNTTVFIFPSLSDPGRLRIDTNFYWKWDIGRDLYLKLNFLDNYDNRPPPQGINHNSSVSTTIGWSF